MRSHSFPKKFGLLLSLFCICLPMWCATNASPSEPEEGFLSPEKYTNAFFGFSLPLPRDPAFHIARISSSGTLIREHTLFGVAQEKGSTLFYIAAQQMDSKEAEQLMRAAQQTSIRGKEFSKGVSHQKKAGGTQWTAMYLTFIDGYLLSFNIYSYDRSIAEDLQHCVEGTRFFDPSKAHEVAGASSREYNPALSH